MSRGPGIRNASKNDLSGTLVGVSRPLREMPPRRHARSHGSRLLLESRGSRPSRVSIFPARVSGRSFFHFHERSGRTTRRAASLRASDARRRCRQYCSLSGSLLWILPRLVSHYRPRNTVCVSAADIILRSLDSSRSWCEHARARSLNYFQEFLGKSTARESSGQGRSRSREDRNYVETFPETVLPSYRRMSPTSRETSNRCMEN